MTATSELRTVIDATAEAVARDPGAAVVTFAVDSDLIGITEVDVRIGGHRVKVDEPEALGGTNLAPNPVEFALAALGACQAITYRFWSEKLGLRIERLEVGVAGDLDVHGVFGLKDGVRPGFGDVDVRVLINGPEPSERYEELRKAVDGHCPVLDVFANEVPVTTTLECRPGTGRA